MKKALALCAVLAVAACDDLDEVDLTRSDEATIPGVPGSPPAPAIAIPLELSLGRAALEAEGVDPDDVDAARIVAVRLEVLSGSNLEDWLQSVAFHVEAPGLARTLIAQRSGIDGLPEGTRSIDLEVPGADLKPYLLAPTALVTAEASGRAPEVDTEIRATTTIRVDVNVSGLLD